MTKCEVLGVDFTREMNIINRRKVRQRKFNSLSASSKLEVLESLKNKKRNHLINLLGCFMRKHDPLLTYPEAKLMQDHGLNFLNKAPFIAKSRDEWNIFTRSKLGDIYKVKDHFPKDNKQYLGIEIECYLPTDKFDRGYGECSGDCFPDDRFEEEYQHYLNNNYSASEVLEWSSRQRDTERDNFRDGFEWDCDCNSGDYIESIKDSIRDARIKGVNVVTDGSLCNDSDSRVGVEFKVLTTIDDMSNLKKLCEWLSDHEAEVDKTCGLHVHVDARSLSSSERQLLVKRYENSLKFMLAMVPDSRKNNTRYCKAQASFTDRYSAINATALDKYNTVEIRLHSGTVNFNKISQWCKLLTCIKYSSALNITSPRKLHRWFELLDNVPNDTREYIINRIAKFTPDMVTESNNTITVTDDMVVEEMSESA